MGNLVLERIIILKMSIKEILCENVDWVNLLQDRVWWWFLVNPVMNFKIP
jgi:hypothetical protein